MKFPDQRAKAGSKHDADTPPTYLSHAGIGGAESLSRKRTHTLHTLSPVKNRHRTQPRQRTSTIRNPMRPISTQRERRENSLIMSHVRIALQTRCTKHLRQAFRLMHCRVDTMEP